ncbi:MAG: hypothetical protein ABIZ09_07755 [Rhodoferax sp.]|jgi:hypothetical protein
MKFSIVTIAAAACATVALSGCVVVPARVQPAYAAPAGVVYVAPTYAMPGVGYAWQYHPRYGWGWHHPSYGWHRGWH